jgi:hypothetical protein
MEKDVSYAMARLLFYTEPTDRALTGWQPFHPYPADASFHRSTTPVQWNYSVKAESENISSALGDELAVD